MPKTKPKTTLPPPSEHVEQRQLITWAALQSGARPELRLLFAIPNGGHRSRATAGRLKAEGVQRGVPDLCLPVARPGYHGLFLEMKRQRHGHLSAEQKAWHHDLLAQGYAVATAKGAEAAMEILLGYLDGKPITPTTPGATPNTAPIAPPPKPTLPKLPRPARPHQPPPAWTWERNTSGT